MEQSYGQCRDCGAKNVKSPKTGKIFCSEKCWLKKDGAVDEYGSYVRHDKPDWDAIRQEKAEGQAKGAVFNKVMDLAIAMYEKGELKVVDIPQFVEQNLPIFRRLNEPN